MKISLDPFPLLLAVLLPAVLAGPARAADVSTYSFAGCAFPDTDQSVSYTATFGEDHDYASTVSTMSFTIYNPVGVSSVTVDNRTGLMWITNPLTDASMGAADYWLDALTDCEDKSYAGFSDWRLPNVRELMSIVDYGKAAAPRINTTAFPGTLNSNYWTSTTYQPDSNDAWVVNFSNGDVNRSTKNIATVYVRCVRGGP